MKILTQGYSVGAELHAVHVSGNLLPQRFDLRVELNVSERAIGSQLAADQVFRARFAPCGSVRLTHERRYSVHGDTLDRYVAVVPNVDATSVLKHGVRIALTGHGPEVALRGRGEAWPVQYRSA